MSEALFVKVGSGLVAGDRKASGLQGADGIRYQEVIRITPSGRIVLKGGATLDPDGRIRGRSEWSRGPSSYRTPTPEDRAAFDAQRERRRAWWALEGVLKIAGTLSYEQAKAITDLLDPILFHDTEGT